MVEVVNPLSKSESMVSFVQLHMFYKIRLLTRSSGLVCCCWWLHYKKNTTAVGDTISRDILNRMNTRPQFLNISGRGQTTLDSSWKYLLTVLTAPPIGDPQAFFKSSISNCSCYCLMMREGWGRMDWANLGQPCLLLPTFKNWQF